MVQSDVNEPRKLALSSDQVQKSVHALLEYVKKTAGDTALLDEPELLHLQICSKLIHTSQQTIKIQLPVKLVRETTDVCLFVKDLNRADGDAASTLHHYKELLQSKGVECITQIMPLKILKTEYGPYEAKHNLSNSYDVYLADQTIIRLLPSLLGKHFYKRGRLPVQVDMTKENLNAEIERALHTANCSVTGRGSSCEVIVASTGMSEADAVQNVIAASQRVAEMLPGGAANIRNMHVKTSNSMAIPLYMSLASAQNVTLPKPPAALPLDEPEDVTPIMGGKVRVRPDGEIEIFPDNDDDETKNQEEEEDETAKALKTAAEVLKAAEYRQKRVGKTKKAAGKPLQSAKKMQRVEDKPQKTKEKAQKKDGNSEKAKKPGNVAKVTKMAAKPLKPSEAKQVKRKSQTAKTDAMKREAGEPEVDVKKVSKRKRGMEDDDDQVAAEKAQKLAKTGRKAPMAAKVRKMEKAVGQDRCKMANMMATKVSVVRTKQVKAVR